MDLDRKELDYLIELLEEDLELQEAGFHNWQDYLKIKIDENCYDEIVYSIDTILAFIDRIEIINKILNQFK